MDKLAWSYEVALAAAVPSTDALQALDALVSGGLDRNTGVVQWDLEHKVSRLV